ncbi:shikimate dehydrogenase family protein [Bosea sp. UC22_33]|uniref:shikimate dehydrogenase family protein n=1 Tax=Bosea sp. UC22_33 TaxID=3350165 RepID=UPI00366C6DAB
MQPITGKTRILFILGDPVAHIIGSSLLNEHFAGRGIDAAVSPLHVAPQDLPVLIGTLRRLRNVAGFGVTIPHKIAVIDLLDSVGERGRLVGAVNFVRRNADGTLHGDNVDGLGFVGGLLQAGVTLKGARILQAGAGGAGRAIAFALAEAGAATLTIANRSPDKAEALAAAVARAYPSCRVEAGDGDPAACDIAVNATSLGMRESDPLPLAADRLPSTAVAAEVVMTPAVTPFLAAAAARGCRTVPGRAMLLAQLRAASDLVGLG